MNKLEISQQLLTEVTGWRHHIHENPELPFQEHETAKFIAHELGALPGMTVSTGVGGTGVVGTLRKGTGKTVVGLRADMDCLPLNEMTDLKYKSQNKGAMHACGHDGHMAMVLGAAKALATDIEFDGTVRFIFQPAEEPGKGAQAMISDGLFEQFPVDALYGLHNMPGLPEGEFHLRTGAIMGSEDNFVIQVNGVGGHASMPHALTDPLVTAAEIIVTLQTIVSRNIPASDAAVLSCTEIITNGSRNAVPGEVTIKGDTRSYSEESRGIFERRIREISEGIAQANGATCRVSYTYEFEPTVNHEQCAVLAADAARTVVGDSKVNTDAVPSMGSEDFGYFAREVPSCFAFLGNGTQLGHGGTPLHSAPYDFNDNILRPGIEYYLEVVTRSLLERTK